MKGFGTSEDSPRHDFDFSSLENNPRYNLESEAATETQPLSLEDTGNNEVPSEPQEPVISDTIDEAISTEAPAESIAPSQTAERPQYTEQEQEDIIFKSLSEKLGREIKSYEDLTTAPTQTVELDPQIQALNEWKQKTGRPVEDFFKFQKDYAQVSDIDVAREVLQLEYPTFTREEINMELENFTALEDDLDNEIAKKNLELKKYATKGRTILNNLKGELGQPSEANYTPEVKQKLDFANQVQQQMQTNQTQQAEYTKGITNAALSSEGMKLNLSEGLSIDFKINDADKKSIPKLIDEMPHWRTEDGKWNHQAVVQDAIKIKHFDTMIKLAYQQGLDAGKDDVIKAAKNSTLGIPNGAEQATSSKKPHIEGLDQLLGGQKLTMKFGRK